MKSTSGGRRLKRRCLVAIAINQMATRLTTELTKGWRHRVNLELDESLKDLAALKEKIGIPSQLSEEVLGTLLESDFNDIILDTLVLGFSLASAASDGHTSFQSLRQIETALSKTGRPESFYLLYEKGKQLLGKGEYCEAVELFLRASWKGIDSEQRMLGLINALFCMEGLGIAYENTLRQVEKLALDLEGEFHFKIIKRQLEAFQLRALVRSGKIEEAIALDRKRPPALLDQGRYYTYWVRSLPFHNAYRPLSKSEIESFVTNRSFLPYKSYRLQTLQGLFHPDDSKIMRPTESCDRLYLWVWKWLESPERFPPQKISALLKEMDFAALAHRMTCEDAQIARNALLWIGLFDPSAEKRLKVLMNLLNRHPDRDFPILSLEYLTVHYLMSLRDENQLLAEDHKITLSQHPLWNSPQLHFKALVESVINGKGIHPPQLRKMALNLKTLFIPSVSEPRKMIVIDLLRYHIIREKEKRVVSQPLCLAFHLLQEHPVVSCEEFVSVCFNLSRYDPLVHNPKIFNLILRMKKMVSPEISIRMKDGQLLSEGSWRQISFINLKQVPRLPDFLNNEVSHLSDSPHSRKARLPHWEGSATRKEIESLLGKPRSTTNRLIAQWAREGAIVRQGINKQITYSLAQGGRKREARYGEH